MKRLIFLFSLLLLTNLSFGQATGKIINNKPFGGTISVDTINAYSQLNIHQTAVGQTISIANLTSGGKIIYIRNTGSASFILSPGGIINPGYGCMLGWTGSAWNVTYGGGSGYLPLIGGTMTGDINFSHTSTGITWTSLGSYIRNYGDGLNISDNTNGVILNGSTISFASDTNFNFQGPNINTSTVPYFDSGYNLVSSSVTPTELGNLSGSTSNIQTQINSITTTGYLKADGSVALTGDLPINNNKGFVWASGSEIRDNSGFINFSAFNGINSNSLHYFNNYAYFSLGIDVRATAGTDILTIGALNADQIDIGRTGKPVNILGSGLGIKTGSYIATIKSDSLINSVTYQLPNKPAGTETIVTKSDLHFDTGALTYTGISVASGTTVNIGACTGWIVDNETTPGSPTYVYVNYAGETGKTVTTVGSGIATYVMLNLSGVIVFQNTFPTSAQRKTMIYLSKIGHPSGTITTAGNEPDFITSALAQSRDWFQAFNYINEGGAIYPFANGANLNINNTTGTIIGNGINFVADKTNPNRYSVASGTAISFFRRTQTGLGGGLVSAIDPANYDVSGTITAVPGGANTSQLEYVYYVPPLGFIVTYGQTTYSSLINAVAQVGKETPVIYSSLVKNAILIGVIAIRKGATQLNNPSDAMFFKADIFGQLIGSVGGTSTGTLQSVYNNSTQPQITTTSTLGAVQITGASTAGQIHVIETGITTPRGLIQDQYNNGTNSSQENYRKARGTFATPLTIVTGDVLSNSNIWGHDGTNFIQTGSIRTTSVGTIGTNRVPSKMELLTSTDASPSVLTTALTLDQSQNAIFAGQIIQTGSVSAGLSTGMVIQNTASSSTNNYAGLSLSLKNSTPSQIEAARINARFATATAGAEVTEVQFQLYNSGAYVNTYLFASNQFTVNTNISLQDKNMILGTTTGTKFGTNGSQKLSFWNATPIVQPVSTTAIDDVLSNVGLRASGGTANFSTAIGLLDATYKTALDVSSSNTLRFGNGFTTLYFPTKITQDATNTTVGTTGNQTINKPTGTVNIAAAGTTVTVTNSLCTTSSIVYAIVRTNDATAYVKNVVPDSGSFVINLGAAATSEVSIGFQVIN